MNSLISICEINMQEELIYWHSVKNMQITKCSIEWSMKSWVKGVRSRDYGGGQSNQLWESRDRIRESTHARAKKIIAKIILINY